MRVKPVLFLLLFLGLAAASASPRLGFLEPGKYEAHLDLRYGPHARNDFDLILPKGNPPYGLVIFIHGGGFNSGSKNALYKRQDDVRHFISNNLAVATINYRYYETNDGIGMRKCLADMQRALQYLRHHAGQYGIDKERVASYGLSAGAGASLYFAFHDDLAIPGDTTLLGESTRLTCAGAINTQSTYDVFRWLDIVPMLRWVSLFKRKELFNAAARFYGYPDYASFKEFRKETTDSLDMLDMIDPGDPPVYLRNPLREWFPDNDNVIQHHRKHAVVVSRALNRAGVENVLVTHKELDKGTPPTLREFLTRHLSPAAPVQVP